MKTMRLLLSVLLAMVCTSQICAQEEVEYGDAYYIYRNDGDFNGFFYDRVQEMRFSKVGIDSIEYDEFVVQEVVTPDSIYRIPLAAIDSVCFVQPEVIFNPRFHYLDQEGFNEYVLGIAWRQNEGMEKSVNDIIVRSDIPEAMLPKIGDTVMGLDRTVYRYYEWSTEGGTGGKVTGIDREGDKLYIRLTPLEGLSDVFTQFIGVEELISDDQGKVRRRVSNHHRSSGSASATLLDLAFSVQKEMSNWYNGEECKLTIAAELGMKLSVGVEYNISWNKLFVKTTCKTSLSAQPSLTLSGGYYREQSWELFPGLCFYFPIECPVMCIEPCPEVFVRAALEASAGLKFPKLKVAQTETFIISDKDGISFNRSLDFDYPADVTFLDLLKEADANVKISGYVQGGIKERLGISTANWIEDIVSSFIGVDIYVGPKLEGEINFSLANLYQEHEYWSGGIKVEFSPIAVDAEAKATFKYLWNDPNTETFATYSKKFFTKEFLLRPELTNERVYHNIITGNGIYVADIATSGFLPMSLGVLVREGDMEVHKHYSALNYQPLDKKVIIPVDLKFDNGKELSYLQPFYSLFGNERLYKTSNAFKTSRFTPFSEADEIHITLSGDNFYMGSSGLVSLEQNGNNGLIIKFDYSKADLSENDYVRRDGYTAKPSGTISLYIGMANDSTAFITDLEWHTVELYEKTYKYNKDEEELVNYYTYQISNEGRMSYAKGGTRGISSGIGLGQNYFVKFTGIDAEPEDGYGKVTYHEKNVYAEGKPYEETRVYEGKPTYVRVYTVRDYIKRP